MVTDYGNPDNLLSNTVKGVSKGVGAVVEPFAAGGKEVLVGLADGAKGILGGTANALSGVFGLGSDFLEALTGLRPFKQRDIEQLAEIRVALAPIVQRYAAEQ